MSTDTKISELDAKTTLDDTDEFVIAEPGVATKRIVASDLITSLGGDFDALGAAAAAQAASQPLDSDLTAIAALSTTAFGRGLLELADAGAARSALSLVPGTDIEAHDADLTTIAGLSPTNDDLLQRKAGAWTNRTIAQLLADLAAAGTTFQPLDSDLTAIAALSTTSFGRSLLTLADAAALLAAAGAASSSRTLTAGDGLSGGGDLSTDRTFAVNVDGTGIEISSDTLQLKDGGVTSAKIADGAIVNADVNASAAIAYSKLNLGTSIVNADVSTSAAIAYSKLNLGTSIVNADVNGSAAIAYSKLNLGTSLVSGDLSSALSTSLAPWTVVTKSLDETVTGSTTLQDDDELFFTAANGTAYWVQFEIIYVSASGAGTPDLKIAFGEDTGKRGAHYFPSLSTADNAQIAPIFSDLTSTAAFGTATTNRTAISIGSHVGAGGTFKLQWAQNTSSGSPNGTTIKAGSRLRYRAI